MLEDLGRLWIFFNWLSGVFHSSNTFFLISVLDIPFLMFSGSANNLVLVAPLSWTNSNSFSGLPLSFLSLFCMFVPYLVSSSNLQVTLATTPCISEHLLHWPLRIPFLLLLCFYVRSEPWWPSWWSKIKVLPNILFVQFNEYMSVSEVEAVADLVQDSHGCPGCLLALLCGLHAVVNHNTHGLTSSITSSFLPFMK